MNKKGLQKIYNNKIKELTKILKRINPEKIILFGSAATGKLHANSDIDFCIIKQGDRLILKRKIWDLLWQADYDWEREVEIHVYSPKIYQDWLKRNDPFLAEVEKGRVVYEK